MITSAGPFAGKFAGELGNSLRVSLCGPTRANLASGNTVVASNSDVALTGTISWNKWWDNRNKHTFGVELRVGDVIQTNNGNTFVVWK